MLRALLGSFKASVLTQVSDTNSPFSRQGQLMLRPPRQQQAVRPFFPSRHIVYGNPHSVSRLGIHSNNHPEEIRARVTKYLARMGIYTDGSVQLAVTRPAERTHFYGFTKNPVLMGHSIVFPMAVASHHWWHQIHAQEIGKNKKLGVLELMSKSKPMWKISINAFSFYLIPKDNLKPLHLVRAKKDQEQLPLQKRRKLF